MQFQRNFYAKLVDSHGNGATEVLVDSSTGVVSIEYGPAMMWNTRYGMGRSAGSMMGSYGRGMMRGQGNGAMMGGSPVVRVRPAATDQGMMGGSGNGTGMMGGYGPAGGTSTRAPSAQRQASRSRTPTRWHSAGLTATSRA